MMASKTTNVIYDLLKAHIDLPDMRNVTRLVLTLSGDGHPIVELTCLTSLSSVGPSPPCSVKKFRIVEEIDD